MHAQCQAWNHHHDPARSYQEDSCHNWSYKCHPNLTPAHQLALGSDLDGAPMDEEWNYSSVVGMMLLYLSTNTSCPDIAFTTASQVVHFSQRKPQQVNFAAIKTIIWYLHSTTSKFGIIIMNLTCKFQVDCYCVASFAGLYESKPHWSGLFESCEFILKLKAIFILTEKRVICSTLLPPKLSAKQT